MNCENKEGFIRFIDYFKSVSQDRIVKIIGEEYLRIMGTCHVVPTMGQYGSFEFAGTLLMWRYCREMFSSFSDKSSIGSFMIGIGDVIGSAFYQMPVSEWSNKLDTVVNNHPEIILYKEWDEVYLCLRDKFSHQIHDMSFNMGIYTTGLGCLGTQGVEMIQRVTYEHFCEEYNALDSFREVFMKFKKDGLRLMEDMDFDIAS